MDFNLRGEFMAVSKAQRKAIDKWNAKHDEVRFRVPIGEKEIIQQHAASCGESTNAFMVRAVRETMARDNEKAEES